MIFSIFLQLCHCCVLLLWRVVLVQCLLWSLCKEGNNASKKIGILMHGSSIDLILPLSPVKSKLLEIYIYILVNYWRYKLVIIIFKKYYKYILSHTTMLLNSLELLSCYLFVEFKPGLALPVPMTGYWLVENDFICVK